MANPTKSTSAKPGPKPTPAKPLPALMQKKWFRIETAKDGAIVSCAEVECKGKSPGGAVRFYEAWGAAEACAAAKAWYDAHRKYQSAYHKARRAAKDQAGECRRCKEPAIPGKTMCPHHDAGVVADNRKAREARKAGKRVEPRRLMPPEQVYANVVARRFEARKKLLNKYGSGRAYDFLGLLQRFDQLGPRNFRAWLVGKIESLGGAKALAEYERTRKAAAPATVKAAPRSARAGAA